MGNFKDTFKGYGAEKDFADEYNRVVRCLNAYVAFPNGGGSGYFDDQGLHLDLASTNAFSGRVFVAGKLIMVTQTTGYILVKFDGSGYTHAATHDMSAAMPDDAEWYDLAKTYGDIHVTRA